MKVVYNGEGRCNIGWPSPIPDFIAGEPVDVPDDIGRACLERADFSQADQPAEPPAEPPA